MIKALEAISIAMSLLFISLLVEVVIEALQQEAYRRRNRQVVFALFSAVRRASLLRMP